MFNHVFQVWNHEFFWESMKPNGGGEPTGPLMEAIKRDFGSFDEFKNQFKAAGMTQVREELGGHVCNIEFCRQPSASLGHYQIKSMRLLQAVSSEYWIGLEPALVQASLHHTFWVWF